MIPPPPPPPLPPPSPSFPLHVELCQFTSHFASQALHVSALQFLILDEADLLLSCASFSTFHLSPSATATKRICKTYHVACPLCQSLAHRFRSVCLTLRPQLPHNLALRHAQRRDRRAQAVGTAHATPHFYHWVFVSIYCGLQVLHNPVTLKLQEEEEEQLLAQFALPPTSACSCV